MPPKKVAELCRLCSLDKRAKIDIFEGEGEIRLLHSKISSCLPVKVLRNDKLPKRICEDCMYKVEMFNDFREATLKSEKELNKFLEEEEKAENEEKERMERENAASETSGDQGDGSPAKEPIVPVDVVIKTETDDVTMDEDEHILGLSDASDSGGGDSKKTEEISKEEDMMNSSDDNSGGEFINKEEDIDSDYEYPQNIQASTFVSVEVDNEQPGPSGLSSGVPSNTDAASSSATASTSATEQPSTSSENLEILARSIVAGCLLKFRAVCKSETNEMPELDITIPTFSAGDIAESLSSNNADPHMLLESSEKETMAGEIKTPFECNMCGKSYRLKGSLNAHINVHHKNRTLKCDVCEQTYTSYTGLKNHKRFHHEGQNFPCQVCSKILKTSGSFKVHMRQHNTEEQLPCQTCGKLFSSKTQLTAHELKHGKDAPYKCQFCEREFYSRFHWKDHENQHTADHFYICQVCNAHYTSYSSYYTHKQKHIPGNFSCELCGKCFITKKLMFEHVKRHIEVRVSYSCSVCGKVLGSRESLKIHHRIHTGEKPYTCEICGKQTRSTTLLREHRRTHTGEKPYSCKICNKRFTQAHNLAFHKKSHQQ